MLRETARPDPTTSAASRRVGTVTTDNGDGSYDVDVSGVAYRAVFSASLAFYRPGERVRVEIQQGKATIP